MTTAHRQRVGIVALPQESNTFLAGKTTLDCLDGLLRMMTAAIDAAGPLDGLLVAPHEATVSETIADVDGHWLGLLRQRLGAIPIIGTIDPHANLSPAMVAATDALIAYRTNPHVDPAAARRHANALGDGLWQARDTFRPALAIIEAALDRAGGGLR